MDEKKKKLLERAVQEGLMISSFSEKKLDEPIPMWVALELVLSLMDKINPPGRCID